MQCLPVFLLLSFTICFQCSGKTIINNGNSTPNASETVTAPAIAHVSLASTTNTSTVILNVTSTVENRTVTSTPAPAPTTTQTTTPQSTTLKTTSPTTPTTAATATAAYIITTAAPRHESKFDGSSFVGGIILALCMVAIGFVGFKFYKSRTEMNYHTL